MVSQNVSCIARFYSGQSFWRSAAFMIHVHLLALAPRTNPVRAGSP